MKNFCRFTIAVVLIISFIFTLTACFSDNDCPICGGSGYYLKKDCPGC